MKERINDQIIEIEKYLQELNEIAPINFEDYQINLEKKAACERYLEKIVEAVLNLCFIFAKEKEFKLSDGDDAIFDVLFQENIISNEFLQKLRDIKGMRNFIIHQYGKINDELVFEAITEQLEKDIKAFINIIKEKMK